VVQLLDVSWRDAGGHGFDALALAWPQQALQIDGGPASLRRARQAGQKGGEPQVELGLPVGSRGHGVASHLSTALM
jgi:hypothetical protein